MLSAIDSDTPRTWLFFNFTVIGSITHDGRSRQRNDPPPSANTCKQVVRLLSWGFLLSRRRLTLPVRLIHWITGYVIPIVVCTGFGAGWSIALVHDAHWWQHWWISSNTTACMSNGIVICLSACWWWDWDTNSMSPPRSQACSVCKGHKLPVLVIYCQQPIVDRHDCS